MQFLPCVCKTYSTLNLASLNQSQTSHVEDRDRARTISRGSSCCDKLSIYNTRTPRPMLLVLNTSTKPAPTHSSNTHSKERPKCRFHLLVLPGRTPANSPLLLLAAFAT